MNLNQFKGQSAVEYMVTYGWMLLAVSVAGGAVYTQVQPECVDSTSGFVGSSVQIQDFGKSDGGSILSMALDNDETSSLRVNEIKVSNEEDVQRTVYVRENMSSGEELVVDARGFVTREVCNDLDVEINYDYGPLKGQVVSGQITSNIGFADILPPEPTNDFKAGYPNL